MHAPNRGSGQRLALRASCSTCWRDGYFPPRWLAPSKPNPKRTVVIEKRLGRSSSPRAGFKGEQQLTADIANDAADIISHAFSCYRTVSSSTHNFKEPARPLIGQRTVATRSGDLHLSAEASVADQLAAGCDQSPFRLPCVGLPAQTGPVTLLTRCETR